MLLSVCLGPSHCGCGTCLDAIDSVHLKNGSKRFGGVSCPIGYSVGVDVVLARDHQDLIGHPFHHLVAESIGAGRGERPGLGILPFFSS